MFVEGDVAQLYRAVQKKKLAECQMIVRKWGSDIITAQCDTFGGWTALHIAAFENHAEIMDWFLQQNVRFDARSSNGDTALFICGKCGSTACAALLLAHGASITITGAHGKAAIDFARENYSTEIVALINEHERRLFDQRNIKPAAREETQPVEPPLLLEATNLLSLARLDEQPSENSASPLLLFSFLSFFSCNLSWPFQVPRSRTH
eukprot:m.78880 g.78880  ORF g.78880 m.78880 type:complete len:207 (+) comp50605_c0_seq3:1005-1625(+)